MKSAWVRRAIFLVFAGLLSVGGYWPGRAIALEAQLGFYNSLQTAAATVFTVMGIWIALLYPEARDKVLKLRTILSVEEERVNAMLQPMLLATLVLGVALFFGPISAAVKTLPDVYAYATELRGLSFAILCLLTFSLFWSVLLTLRPIDYIQDEFTRARIKKETIDRLEKNLPQRSANGL